MNPTTFEHDLIGYENFADSLENFIKVEQQFVEGSLVIALSAEFGAGKTTFLTMLQHKLKNPKEEDNEKNL
jgi:tRNA A37 threonylcarbamoyladenosine biosynthesis protein TsaE